MSQEIETVKKGWRHPILQGNTVELSEKAMKDSYFQALTRLAKRDHFQVLSTGRCLCGQSTVDVELDIPHPKGIRTWMCGSLFRVIAA
ncbi:MAG: hypothetical protein PHF79_02260 [Candidatus Pacebacteria bacterium]|nr:hypothetical protein [Candidatus Paceibacterota bacterium]